MISANMAASNLFRPLAGRRVLDLTKILAGPLCTQVLADMGADVIKIEPPRGDDTRHWPPFQDGTGTIFLSVNRNKRSLAIDLKQPDGLALCQKICAGSDILVESFGPGVAERLGLGWDATQALNPKLVYASISGYGTQGPMRDAKGYDLIAQAFAGMLSITGQPDGAIARSPFSPVDQATGLNAVIAILGGIIQADATGRGVKLDTSLFDSAVGLLGYILQGFWQTGREPQRRGSAHESLCPYEAFETSDHPIILGVANDSLWRAFADLAGHPQWADDPRYATGAARVAHRAEVVAMVAAILLQKPRAEWLALLEARGIPTSPVNNLGQLTAHPHTAASGMVLSAGEFKTVASPFRAHGQRLPIYATPPALGEQGPAILGEFGFSPSEIEDLIDRRIVFAPAQPRQAEPDLRRPDLSRRI